MATLYISEFQALGSAGMPTWGASPNGPTQAAQQPSLVDQVVAIGGTSTQSSAFGAATVLVRIHTDSICSVAFGTNPTATATTARLVAGQTEYFGVAPLSKVAVITNT